MNPKDLTRKAGQMAAFFHFLDQTGI